MTKIGRELDCGCELWSTLGRPDILFCPKHKAAPDMYEALKNLDGYYLIPELREPIEQAIAKAEGGNDDTTDVST